MIRAYGPHDIQPVPTRPSLLSVLGSDVYSCIDTSRASTADCNTYQVQGSGIEVQGSGFRVQGLGFRDKGSGFRD